MPHCEYFKIKYQLQSHLDCFVELFWMNFSYWIGIVGVDEKPQNAAPDRDIAISEEISSKLVERWWEEENIFNSLEIFLHYNIFSIHLRVKQRSFETFSVLSSCVDGTLKYRNKSWMKRRNQKGKTWTGLGIPFQSKNSTYFAHTSLRRTDGLRKQNTEIFN